GRPGGGDACRRVRARGLPPARRRHRCAAYGNRLGLALVPGDDVSALQTIRDAPGLDEYLDKLETRLVAPVLAHRGLRSEVGGAALRAGGKRLRPLLCFFSAPPEAEPPVAQGVAVELVHMATLVHDDLIDGAEFRRGHASAWSTYGEPAARAAGDYLFARAFAELTAAGG